MSGKVFLGLVSKGRTGSIPYGLNLWGPLRSLFHSTALKTERVKNETLINSLSFEAFQAKHIESLEVFKNSAAVKALCGNDLEKITAGYRRFCLSQYSQYKHQAYGKNPSLFV